MELIIKYRCKILLSFDFGACVAMTTDKRDEEAVIFSESRNITRITLFEILKFSQHIKKISNFRPRFFWVRVKP
jgi:alpha/beta superfamily hydrolase